MTKPNCICAKCGKEHYRRPAYIKKTKYTCCSRKCRAELLSQRYKGDKNPAYGKSYNKGVPRSKEVREKISTSNKLNIEFNKQKGRRLGKSNKGKKFPERSGKNNPMYGRADIARKGFFALQKIREKNKEGYLHDGTYMRSTWEVKFAKWLDKKNIRWEYEPRYFVCGNLGWYYPDFYIKDWNKFIEVKGYESKVGMDKFNYCKNHYTKYKFELYNQSVLKNLGIL